jgi:hypothetical protein
MELWDDELEAIEKYERAVARRKYLGSASGVLRVIVRRPPTPEEQVEHERLMALVFPDEADDDEVRIIERVEIGVDGRRVERPGPAYTYGRQRP